MYVFCLDTLTVLYTHTQSTILRGVETDLRKFSSFDVCILSEDFSGVETLYKVTNLLVTHLEVSN